MRQAYSLRDDHVDSADMKRLLFLTALLLVLPGATGATARSSTTTARQPLLATRDGTTASRLFYADPVSLQPIPARSLHLDFHWGDFLRSPNGSLLALSRNDAPELRFVRLHGLRFAGAMSFTEGQFVRLVSWPSPHLLLALVDSSQVLAIDPTARKVLWRRSIDGSVIDIQPAPGGVVALAAPAARIGPSRIVVLGTDGSRRSVLLERVLAGFHRNQSWQDFTGTIRTPGLAVDAGGKRAYVVGASEPVAQIDFASMRVSYHGGDRGLAKAARGPRRQATWLGNGLLAVSGTDSSISTDVQSKVQESITPSGLVLINTRTWTSRSVQRNADTATTVDRLLLAYRSGYDSGTNARVGSGLTIYRLDGRPFAHILGRTPISRVQVQGGLAYAWLTRGSGPSDQVAVVDLRSGRILARETRSIVLLTGS